MSRTAAALLAALALGCGGPSEPTPRTPASSSNAPPEAGAEELEIVEGVVHDHLDEIAACGAAQHDAAPGLAGEVDVRWRVAADGSVDHVTIVSSTLATDAAPDGGEPARAIERCIVGAVGTWRHPPIEGGDAVTVHHAFPLALPVPATAPMASAPAPTGVPRIRTSTATIEGPLTPEVLRRVIRRHISEVRDCYERALVVAPDLTGTLTPHFVIDATGAVLSGSPAMASSSLASAAAADGGAPARAHEVCVLDAVGHWTFPAPDGGRRVTVDYPFVLSVDLPDPAPAGEAPSDAIGTNFGYGS